MIAVFALGRDDKREWALAHYTACVGEALREVEFDGGVLGIPREALAKLRAMLGRQEAAERVESAALATGTRLAEEILGKLFKPR